MNVDQTSACCELAYFAEFSATAVAFGISSEETEDWFDCSIVHEANAPALECQEALIIPPKKP